MSRKNNYTAIVRDLIMEAADNGRRITATSLVTLASHPRHPLHNYFDWDDERAGHKFRVAQARELISRVRIEVLSRRDLSPAYVPAYVRDPSAAAHEQGMLSVKDVLSNTQRSEAVFAHELDRIASYLWRTQQMAIAMGYEDRFDAMLDHFRIRQAAHPAAAVA